MGSYSSFQDTTLREIASRLLSQRGLDRHVKDLVAFTDDEYRKVYAAYNVTTQSAGRYVLKRALEKPELHTYREILQQSDPTPALLAYERIGDGLCWLLLEYMGDNDIRDMDLSRHKAAARALAEFHAHHWGVDGSSYSFLKSSREQFRCEQRFLDNYKARPGDPDLQQLVSLHTDITRRLSDTPLTVVHADLLSMNILHDDYGAVTIIDWDSTMIGSYARDLGQWLGDLRHDNAAGWVPEPWVEPVLRAYYERQCQMLGDRWKTWVGMLEDFAYGRCFNYLVIVLSHLKHDWSRSGWYQANLTALRYTGATLPGLEENRPLK